MSSTLVRWFGLRKTTGEWIIDRYRGPHGERDYAVYLPARRLTRRARPVVLLLHGCRQSAAEFAELSRFTAVADRHGLILVAPEQHVRNHRMRCWRWYERKNQGRERGEPAVLAGLVDQVLAEPARWRADPGRVYAVGLSAGGAMALTLAATYPDVFAAVGAHSAPPYRSAAGVLDGVNAMAGRSRLPEPEGTSGMAPAVVFHGMRDAVVHPDNAGRVAGQWVDHWDTRPDAEALTDRVEHDLGLTKGRRARVSRWHTTGGLEVLEQWQVDGLGHAWSGGLPDREYSDPDGPEAATEMWRFLARHRLATHHIGQIGLRPAG